MNVKKIISLLLVLFGEALLIISFLYFGRDVQSEILTLNIIVSSIIYGLWFIYIISPWIDFRDESQKAVGSIGLRWFFTFFYTLLAIGTMVVFNTVKPINFADQLIIHGILFFLLLAGLFMAFSSSDKVEQVYLEQKQNRDGIDEMRKATNEVQLRIDAMKNIPPDIISKLTDLQEQLRCLSPCDTDDAYELEKKFVSEMRILNDSFFESPHNIEKINECLLNCERTYKERKKVFSI